MVDIREQSPLTLAFVGDAVYTLLIREHIATDKRQPINKLNQLSVKYISAKGQFMALGLITEILTEEEQNMVRRGKNASKASVAKHASVEEYRSSTGFECMLGYLKLTGQADRIKYLVDYIFENLKFEN
ncbi:MAG: cysteine--tRNA ligase [Oscillospiraceae bacterium]|nr:cysteine--tRNA ligase [Oscillospiraceae bacterium]MBP1552685.1 cysteine--tRNA ligase [Oscillospiraceae bacterium]MBP1570351.1 cysteine--tRNA ligase [Oscillospiraceae bacterium]MBQ5312776.1 cysteine--tRNA ligase [Oscillospiraceae bacterium]